MQLPTAELQQFLHTAVAAARQGEAATREALDRLPAPIYTTDAAGLITYFNKACVAFAGRTPELGKDSWCVSWRLFTRDGKPLPHDQCPMAVAIRQGRSIRGGEAVAERPDGSRVTFTPYPTPLLDDDGNVVGAVNMLIDVTRRRQVEYLRSQGRRCRMLAAASSDQRTAGTLSLMAQEYEQKAQALQRPN